MPQEPEDRLALAARELRTASIHRDVLDRGERAVLARIATRRGSNRPVLLWAAGFGMAAIALAATILAPARASAAEIRRIAQNADRGLRHVRAFTIAKDGTMKPGWDLVAESGRRRMLDPTGWQMAYDGRVCDVLFADGAVEREYGGPKAGSPANPIEGLARDLLAANANGPGARLRVERNVPVNGRPVDRYTIDQEIHDDREGILQSRTVLLADPATERPLELRARTTGQDESLTLWDYPAPDPTLFRLPIGPNTPVYDLPAERASVLAARRRPGQKATLGGQEVELLQVWVDEGGDAAAIARADYAYPLDYGLQIEGMDAMVQPEKPPFSGQWMIQKPTLGGEQLFFLNRFRFGHLRKPARVHYPDFLTLRLPVCRGKRLLGYARFEHVPVHRTHSVYSFLRPPYRMSNAPFWEKPDGTETPTAVAPG